MTWDRRTRTLRRAVWGYDPLQQALIVFGGAVAAFGTYLAVVIALGIF